jgi:uncharacterized protein Smg (DUF494 family)
MKDESLAFRRIIRLQRRLRELGFQPDDIFGALDDLEQLRRGEFICKKCGLRKNADQPADVGF